MDNIINFREEALAIIEDEIEYRLEEMEETLVNDYFDEFYEFIDKELKAKGLDEKLDENEYLFYFYDRLNNYYKDVLGEVKFYINKVNKLVQEVYQLLRRRLFIKVKNGEIIGVKDSKNEMVFLKSDEYDVLTLDRLTYLTNIEELPFIYSISLDDKVALKEIMSMIKQNPNLPVVDVLKRVPKH